MIYVLRIFNYPQFPLRPILHIDDSICSCIRTIHFDGRLESRLQPAPSLWPADLQRSGPCGIGGRSPTGSALPLVGYFVKLQFRRGGAARTIRHVRAVRYKRATYLSTHHPPILTITLTLDIFNSIRVVNAAVIPNSPAERSRVRSLLWRSYAH